MSKKSKIVSAVQPSTQVADLLEHIKLHQAVQFQSGGWLDHKDMFIIEGLLQYVQATDPKQLTKVLDRLISTKQYIPRNQTSKWQYLSASFFMSICSFFDVCFLLFTLSRVCKSWAAMIKNEPWQTCFVLGPKFSQSLHHRMDYLRLWHKARLRNITQLKIEHVHERVNAKEQYQYGTPRIFIMHSLDQLIRSFPKLKSVAACLEPIVSSTAQYPTIEHLDQFRVMDLTDFMFTARMFPNLVTGKFRIDIDDKTLQAFEKDHKDLFHTKEEKEGKEGKDEKQEQGEQSTAHAQNNGNDEKRFLPYFQRWKHIQNIQLAISIRLDYHILHRVKERHVQLVCSILKALLATFATKLTNLQLTTHCPNWKKFNADIRFWKLLSHAGFNGLTELSLGNIKFRYKHLDQLQHLLHLKRLVLQNTVWSDKIILKETETSSEYIRPVFPQLPRLQHLVCINVAECRQRTPKERRVVENIDPVAYFQQWANVLSPSTLLEICTGRDHSLTYKSILTKVKQIHIPPAQWHYTLGVPDTLPLTFDWHHMPRIPTYGYGSDLIEHYLLR